MAFIRPKVLPMGIMALTAVMIFTFLNGRVNMFMPAKALAAEDAPFYKGKTMRIIVPSSPGGGYDVYSRLVAKFLPKYLPGAHVIVQNMPAAGGEKAATFMYKKARKDGLTLAISRRTALWRPQILPEKYDYKSTDFEYLISGAGGVFDDPKGGDAYLIMLRREVVERENIRGPEDLDNPNLKWASTTGPASLTNITAYIFNIKGRDIPYEGTSEGVIAVEGGEADGWAPRTLTDILTLRRNWFDLQNPKKGFLVPIVQIVREVSYPNWQDIPLGINVVKDPLKRELLELVRLPNRLHRAFYAPPGTPSDRVKVLRDAFWQTFNDPELLKKADQMEKPIAPKKGEDVDKIIKTTLSNISPEAKKIARDILLGPR